MTEHEAQMDAEAMSDQDLEGLLETFAESIRGGVYSEYSPLITELIDRHAHLRLEMAFKDDCLEQLDGQLNMIDAEEDVE